MPSLAQLIRNFDANPNFVALKQIADQIERSGRMEDELLATRLRSAKVRQSQALAALNTLRAR